MPRAGTCCWSIEESGALLKGSFAPVWDRGPQGGIALGNMGAFLVLESRDHAQARGARARGRISSVSFRPQPASDGGHRGDAPPPMGGDRRAGRPRARRGDFRRRRARTGDIGRARGAQGHWPSRPQYRDVYRAWRRGSVHGAIWGSPARRSSTASCSAPAGAGDVGTSPSDLSQVVVTSVGNWRGEGLGAG